MNRKQNTAATSEPIVKHGHEIMKPYTKIFKSWNLGHTLTKQVETTARVRKILWPGLSGVVFGSSLQPNNPNSESRFWQSSSIFMSSWLFTMKKKQLSYTVVNTFDAVIITIVKCDKVINNNVNRITLLLTLLLLSSRLDHAMLSTQNAANITIFNQSIFQWITIRTLEVTATSFAFSRNNFQYMCQY